MIDMIPYESDDVSSDVKPLWIFQTYLGNLRPTATRMSAPCVSAWRPPWARSCWPQAPRASASWLWILFHVVSKKYLVFDLICRSKSGKSVTGECALVV